MITYTRQRFTAATLTNGKYELTSERQTVTDQILFIPGVSSPLAELKNLLFKQGQAGGIWVPSLSPTMISSNSFGTGVQTFLDLSGNGKNATQASSGSRPAWGRVPKSGRRNLLERTEEFDNAYWNKFSSGTASSPVVTPNAATAPDGAMTADMILFDAGAGTTTSDRCEVLKSGLSRESGQSIAGSIWLRGAVGGEQILLRTSLGRGYQLQTLTTSWQKFSTVAAATATDTNDEFGFGIRQGQSGIGTINASATVYAWQAQREIGAASTADQKVTTAFDITESGQRDCYYLQPDGVDDGMATASIDFSGTDKVTVFAAVRKLSDTDQTILEHATAGSPTSTGAIRMFIGQWGIQCRRPTTRTASVSSGFDAPLTSVLTGEIRSNTYLSLAVDNGAAVVQTADQGADPFLNTPLYFFERSNATNQASLQCFGLIFAGGQYPTSTIQRVRRILSRYTPGVSL